MIYALLSLPIILIITLMLKSFKFQHKRLINRLEYLSNSHENILENTQVNAKTISVEGCELESLKGRFGNAGCLVKKERYLLIYVMILISAVFVVLGGYFWGIIGICVGVYLGILVSLWYLKFRALEFSREVLFKLPLALESIILLVESGLGVLPALEKVISIGSSHMRKDPVLRILWLVYQLSAHGMPFKKAASLVANSLDNRPLRHVLLHLDVGDSEGGEVIPSLRALSDHSHLEWKVSVETRVKKLENAVVFPVFASVLGLMALILAVPLVSLEEFSRKIEKKPTLQTTNINNANSNNATFGNPK